MLRRPCQIKAKELEKQDNKTDHLVIPLNNVYEPLDVEFPRESSNEHDDESTLKEAETQESINFSYTHWSISYSHQRQQYKF